MNITLSQNSISRASFGRARFSIFRSVGVAAIILAAAASVFAQDDRRRRGGDPNGGGGDRGNFNPQDMQARMMGALRERFEVANDDEWAIISERITKVSELRRASFSTGMGGMMFGRGGPGGDRGGGDRGTSGRSSRSGSTDVAALQSAIQDKMPEAEIKARLERVREQRKNNEAQLAKAQEELRAVLSVRQEAIAVLAGLLQ